MTAPQNDILTVSQLTQAIKQQIESTFSFVHLQGEVTNFKIQTSGHYYFSIKDATAQISAVMFKGDTKNVKAMPKDGDHVIVKGELNVYPPKGNYQLIVRDLSFAGLGELLLQLEALKIKLHQLGWFKQSRKKPLPLFPKTIGVVTSPTGAVIQDILNVLTRRFSGFRLILNPVKVQGEGAALEIAEAINQFNQHKLVDVIIVARGGGSLEDLWAFNDERVATALYNSKIPTISAVGHETDHCIADYVADVRAPTPSAAAEIVIAEKKQCLERFDLLRKRICQTLIHGIQKNRYRLEGLLKQPAILQPFSMIEWRMQKLDDIQDNLDISIKRICTTKNERLKGRRLQALSLNPTKQLLHNRQHLAVLKQRIDSNTKQEIKRKKEQINAKQAIFLNLCQRKHSLVLTQSKLMQIKIQLNQLICQKLQEASQKIKHTRQILAATNPKNVLKKGYSILFAEKDQSIINSVECVHEGQLARLMLADGELSITLNQVINRES